MRQTDRQLTVEDNIFVEDNVIAGYNDRDERKQKQRHRQGDGLPARWRAVGQITMRPVLAVGDCFVHVTHAHR